MQKYMHVFRMNSVITFLHIMGAYDITFLFL